MSIKWKECSFLDELHEIDSHGFIMISEKRKKIIGITGAFQWKQKYTDIKKISECTIQMMCVDHDECVCLQSVSTSIITLSDSLSSLLLKSEMELQFSTILVTEYELSNELHEWNISSLSHMNDDTNVIIKYSDCSIGLNILQSLSITVQIHQSIYHQNELIGWIITPHSPRNSNGCLIVNQQNEIMGMILLTDTLQNNGIVLHFDCLLSLLNEQQSMMSDDFPIYTIVCGQKQGTCFSLDHYNDGTLLVSTAHLFRNREDPFLIEMIVNHMKMELSGHVLFFSHCLDLVIIYIPLHLPLIQSELLPCELHSVSSFIGYELKQKDHLIHYQGELVSFSKRLKSMIIYCNYVSVGDGMSGGVMMQNKKAVGMIQRSDDDFTYCLPLSIVFEVIDLMKQQKSEEDITIALMDYGIIAEGLWSCNKYYQFN